MGFTAPVVRATDFLVTAPIWTAEHVDNWNTAVMTLRARRTSDQSVTSSTAFVSDTVLQLPVGANEVYKLQFHVRYDGSTTGDIKISFSLPTSGQIDAAASGSMMNPAGSFADATWAAVTTTDSSPLGFAAGGAGLPRTLIIDGTYIGAGTAGTVILRWAQNTSDATATRTLTHSTLWAVKLA